MKACEVIVPERKKQLADCKKELLTKLNEAVKMEKTIGKTSDESYFRDHVRVTRTEGVGDKEAIEIAQELFDEVGIAGPVKPVTNKISDNIRRGTKDDSDIPKAIKDLIWEHRAQTHDIRCLTKELVGRVRSLRHVTVVRDLQKQADTPPVVHFSSCERDGVPVDEIAVLLFCGHMGCYTCVMACAEREECVYAASGACKAAARVLNVVKGDILGVDHEARDGSGKRYGLKLEKVMHLIKYVSNVISRDMSRAGYTYGRQTISKDERVLVLFTSPISPLRSPRPLLRTRLRSSTSRALRP